MLAATYIGEPQLKRQQRPAGPTAYARDEPLHTAVDRLVSAPVSTPMGKTMTSTRKGMTYRARSMRCSRHAGQAGG